MSQENTEQGSRRAMREAARWGGLELDETRIEADLPAFEGYMAAVQRLIAVELAMEAEPPLVLRLSRKAAQKEGE